MRVVCTLLQLSQAKKERSHLFVELGCIPIDTCRELEISFRASLRLHRLARSIYLSVLCNAAISYKFVESLFQLTLTSRRSLTDYCIKQVTTHDAMDTVDFDNVRAAIAIHRFTIGEPVSSNKGRR